MDTIYLNQVMISSIPLRTVGIVPKLKANLFLFLINLVDKLDIKIVLNLLIGFLFKKAFITSQTNLYKKLIG